MNKPKGLVIAEKPSLMRELEKAYKKSNLNAELKFVTLVGHVYRTLLPDEIDEKYKVWKKEDLPIMPSGLKYKPEQKTYSLLKAVKDALSSDSFDFVVNGCDAGREGEAIFFEVYNNLKLKMPVKRIWASDLEETTLVKAIENMLEYKNEDSLKNLMYSSFLRQEFDWLFGMNLSRAITLANRKNIPVGRVMTPTLKIIVDRELEIQKFKSQGYFEIHSFYKDDFQGVLEIDFEKTIKTKKEADEIYSKVKNEKTGTVINIDKKEAISYAPTLHSLLELQKEANTAFSFTAKKTLDVAQSLYEKHKLITYPRTSSRFLPKSMEKSLLRNISSLKNHDLYNLISSVGQKEVSALMKNPNYVDDAKITDHHAITVTHVPYRKGVLSKDEENLYSLIVKRLISLFLGPEKSIMTDLVIDINNYKFRTKAKEVTSPGYKILYPSTDKSLKVSLKKGDKVDVDKISLLEKETKPPKRYTDSSLLSAMLNPTKEISEEDLKKILKESEGLGTEATRSSIIEKLIDNKMVKRNKKALEALPFGIEIISILKNSQIASPIVTATWEKRLRQIETGSLNIDDFKKDMRLFIEKETKDSLLLKGNFNQTEKTKDKLIGKCPKCGANVYEDKYSYSCENNKKTCDFSMGKEILSRKISMTEVKKILKGEKTKEMEFTSKDGKKFKSCLVFKNGKISFEFTENRSKNETKSEKICKCSCKGNIIEDKFNYLCDSCSLKVSKIILGTSITKDDIKKLIKDKETSKKEFTSKNGKDFSAKLVLKNNKTEFSFE